jgi:hypothetical protein
MISVPRVANFVSLILDMETTPLYDGILTEDQLLDSMVLLNEYTTFWDGKVRIVWSMMTMASSTN